MLFCGSTEVVHNGLKGHKQLYKCKSCSRQFIGGNRRAKTQVITDYIDGKQTQRQLTDKYGVSSRTITRDLEDMRYVRKIARNRRVVIQMDTPYWGRGLGLMAIKNALRNRILWRKYVNVFDKPQVRARCVQIKT